MAICQGNKKAGKKTGCVCWKGLFLVLKGICTHTFCLLCPLTELLVWTIYCWTCIDQMAQNGTHLYGPSQSRYAPRDPSDYVSSRYYSYTNSTTSTPYHSNQNIWTSLFGVVPKRNDGMANVIDPEQFDLGLPCVAQACLSNCSG